MKNRGITIILFIILFVLTSCSSATEIENEDIYGSYECYKWIYVAPWSSTIPNPETGQCQNKYVYEITSIKFSIHDEENNLIEIFENIEYISVDIYEDIDEIFLGFGLEDILVLMLERYDIYINDNRIGYSIFIGSDKIYIAETTYTGGSRDIFAVWAIFELKIPYSNLLD